MIITILCPVADIELEKSLNIIPTESTIQSVSKHFLRNYTLNKPLEENQIILNRGFLDHIGLVEMNEFRKNWFLFKEFQTVSHSELDLHSWVFNELNEITSSFEFWLIALWLVKDNSITLRSFYAYYTIEEGEICQRVRLDNTCFMANGKQKKVKFSELELKEAEEWLPRIEKFQKIENDKSLNTNYEELVKGGFVFVGDSSNEIYKENNSFERSWRFINIARRQDFLPSKIAFYISALESLFAVKGENTHQTSERAAVLLGGNAERKYDIYKKVKDAYSVRSSYVHGSHISGSRMKKLEDVSTNLDVIVRRVVKKVMTDCPELNHKPNRSDEINDWFIRLILK